MVLIFGVSWLNFLFFIFGIRVDIGRKDGNSFFLELHSTYVLLVFIGFFFPFPAVLQKAVFAAKVRYLHS